MKTTTSGYLRSCYNEPLPYYHTGFFPSQQRESYWWTNNLEKDLSLEHRRSKALQACLEFLNKVSSEVDGRDELRDEIKEIIKEFKNDFSP